MSEPKSFTCYTCEPDLPLTLHRYLGTGGDAAGSDAAHPSATNSRKPVLLLHGASGNHGTFLVSRGGLARYLFQEGFDPWMLEWRGSGLIVDALGHDGPLATDGDAFNFNLAAKNDVRAAVSCIQKTLKHAGPIGAVGFCMGSATLAEAIALGFLQREVDCVVLMTLGLFYETPFDGRLKSEERVLEQLKGSKTPNGKPFVALDPRAIFNEKTRRLDLRSPWPDRLDRMYQEWPSRLRGHNGETRPPAQEMCNRLAFMYGMPYHHPNLVDEIHGTAEIHPTLPNQFGGIPLQMFINAAVNVRKGHATIVDARVKRTTKDFLSSTARQHFANLSKLTLITGDLNRLWHRNSIDLMHEWLCRGSSGEQFPKHVMPGYGHQDLLWGKKAEQQVYPLVAERLRTPARATRLSAPSTRVGDALSSGC